MTLFTPQKKIDFFKNMSNFDFSTDVVDTQPRQEGDPRLKAKLDNVILLGNLFEPRISHKLRVVIVDSVEYSKVFSAISVIKGQEWKFKTLPDDLNSALYGKGLHFVQMFSQSKESKILIYSIDPSFEVKVKEKIERKAEREDQRVKKAFAQAEKERMIYMPRSRLATNENPGIICTEEGDEVISNILEQSSSESEDDNESAAFLDFIQSGMDPLLPDTMEQTSFEIITQEEHEKKIERLSNHIRNPSNYELADQETRDFLDANLRIAVQLCLFDDNYVINGMQFSIKNRSK